MKKVSTHPKVSRTIIGPFKLYEEVSTLDVDREPLPPHEHCLSDNLIPALDELNQYVVREYHNAWAQEKYNNKFMFAGPTVNIAKGMIIKASTGTSFPAPRMTAAEAFTQRFVDYNIEKYGDKFANMMPFDIDQTGALEKFITIIKNNNLPLPLIIKNRVSGRFQGHYFFTKFHNWDTLWVIRDAINKILTTAGIKIDCRKYYNTRNAFFNPWVMDEETGELNFQKKYTNCKDLSKDYKELQFQAHEAEVIMFDDFRRVELSDFYHLTTEGVDDEEDENEEISIEAGEVVATKNKSTQRASLANRGKSVSEASEQDREGTLGYDASMQDQEGVSVQSRPVGDGCVDGAHRVRWLGRRQEGYIETGPRNGDTNQQWDELRPNTTSTMGKSKKECVEYTMKHYGIDYCPTLQFLIKESNRSASWSAT